MPQQTLFNRTKQWLRRFTLRDQEARELFVGSKVRAGVAVNQATAMTYSAVYNAVTIYAQTIASLPLHVYRTRPDGGKERATDYPLYRVLHDRPNPLLDSYRFRELMMVYLLLWGNFYAEVIERDGYEDELWPIPPWRAQPQLMANGRDIQYQVTLPDGRSAVLPRERVFHVAGMGFDGLRGKSIISLARESLGLGMAAEAFGAQFFGSGANMAGVLEHPGSLSDKAHERLRQHWKELYTGLDNAHRVAILEEGMKYTRIGIPPEDAQFLQTREFQVEEVARWFNLPPHMLKDLRRSTFSNIEHQALEFVKYSLLPWLRRIEAAIKHQLLAGADEQDLFAEFIVEGLLRGDTESRYRAYATARQWGWLSANDIRRLENLDPIEGGDVYLQPLNMVPAGTTPQAARSAEPTGSPREERSVRGRLRLRDAYRPVVEDAVGRLVRREVSELRRRARRIWAQGDTQEWKQFLAEFYREFVPAVVRTMEPVMRSLAEQVYGEAMDEIGVNDAMGPDFERFVGDYLEVLGARWRRSSEGQLKRVLEEAGDDPLAAIEARLDAWEQSRAQGIARREVVRASEAFAKAAWALAGVTAVRWTVTTEDCPFCDHLEGRVASVSGWFAQAGDTISAPDRDGLVVRGNIGHPPLHDGCTCALVPVVGSRSAAGEYVQRALRSLLEQAREEESPCPSHEM